MHDQLFPFRLYAPLYAGVTRKTLTLWMKGLNLAYTIGPQAKLRISENLLFVRKCICKEFARKGRGLLELDRWKAIELRLFLLHTSVVALHGHIHETLNKNFLLFSTAIRILAHPRVNNEDINAAGKLLVEFVKHYQ